MLPLLLTLLLIPQASAEAERLWESGERELALDLMAEEFAGAPADRALCRRLVQGELLVGRFQRALEFSQGLGAEDRGLRGQALYFLTRYDEALAELDRDRPAELLMHAEALRALGRFDALEELLPHMRATLGATATPVRLLEAQFALRRGDTESAIPILRDILKRDPLEMQALFGLGRALVKAGRREEGLRWLQRHRELIPLLDQLDFARRGVALAPKRGSNQVALGEALRPLLVHDPRLVSEAREAFERGLQLATPAESVPITLRCARFQWESLGEREAAVKLLTEAVAKAPDVRLRVRLSDYLAELGRRTEALTQLVEAARARPDDPAIRQRMERLRQEDPR